MQSRCIQSGWTQAFLNSGQSFIFIRYADGRVSTTSADNVQTTGRLPAALFLLLSLVVNRSPRDPYLIGDALFSCCQRAIMLRYCNEPIPHVGIGRLVC